MGAGLERDQHALITMHPTRARGRRCMRTQETAAAELAGLVGGEDRLAQEHATRVRRALQSRALLLHTESEAAFGQHQRLRRRGVRLAFLFRLLVLAAARRRRHSHEIEASATGKKCKRVPTCK